MYYGRVLRQGGWIVLHYLFFYAMNNWRSGFHGTNDHEADWEQVFVYLYEPGDGGPPVPWWVAYASHDFRGTTCAGGGTIRCSSERAAIRWSTPAPAPTPATSSRANTSWAWSRRFCSR